MIIIHEMKTKRWFDKIITFLLIYEYNDECQKIIEQDSR